MRRRSKRLAKKEQKDDSSEDERMKDSEESQTDSTQVSKVSDSESESEASSSKYSKFPPAPKKGRVAKSRIEESSDDDGDDDDDEKIGTQLSTKKSSTRSKGSKRKSNNNNGSGGGSGGDDSSDHVSDSESNNGNDNSDYDEEYHFTVDKDEDDYDIDHLRKKYGEPLKKKPRVPSPPQPPHSQSSRSNNSNNNNTQQSILKYFNTTTTGSNNNDNDNDNDDDDDNDSGIAGTIQSVELDNFMSHRHFITSFEPHVNFIVGANGSGKSAILIALSVALGAKASFTQRGQSVRELITQGEQTARVRVTLTNCGVDAYHPEVYGAAITVERVISANGGNTYRLKDERGRTQESGRSALQDMLSHLGISVENPCVLLMQDTAKQFLWKQSASAKYDFFTQATMIDKYFGNKRNAEHLCDNSQATLCAKESLVPELRREVSEYERERERATQLDRLEARAEALKQDFAWAVVSKKRREHAALEAKYSAAVDRRRAAEALERKLDAQAADILAENTRQAGALEASQGAIAEHESRREQLRVARSEIIGERERIAAERADVEKRLPARRRQLDILRKSADDARKRAAEEVSQSQSRVTAERSRLTEVRDSTREALALERSAEAAAGSAVREQQVRAVQTRRKADETHAETEKARKHKNDLKRQSKTRVAAFGQRMPELLQRIAEAQRRGELRGGAVLGPIGCVITLKDLRWAAAVESVLKQGILGSFVVFDNADAAYLHRQARALGFSVSVYIVARTGRRYALADEPPPTMRTVLRVLDIADPDVANALVDHHHIHKIALVESPAEGFAALKAAEAADPATAPTEAFTAAGDRLVLRNKSSAFYPHPRHARSRVWFGVDYDAEINACERAIKDTLEPAERTAAEAAAAESARLKELEIAHRNANEKLRAAAVAARTAEAKLAQFERTERERVLPDIDDLERQAAEVQKGIAEKEAALTELDRRLEEIDRKAEAIKQERQLCIAEGNTLRSKMDDLRKTVLSLQSSYQVVIDKKNAAKKDLDAASAAAAHLAEQAQALLRDTEVDAEKARRICPEERDVQRDPEEVSRELAATVQELEGSRRSMRSVAEIDADLSNARMGLAKACSECSSAKANLTELRHSLNDRTGEYNSVRDKTTRRVKRLFSQLIEQRNCRGGLIINHEERTVDIDVSFDPDKMTVPANSSNSNSSNSGGGSCSSLPSQPTNTKALSGGERSFSTISFLLSLWEAVESPFCALDEFDVFMDSVNRTVAIQSLIKFAKMYKTKQIIVITPQTDLQVDYSEYVTIKRLKPPVRGIGSSSSSST